MALYMLYMFCLEAMSKHFRYLKSKSVLYSLQCIIAFSAEIGGGCWAEALWREAAARMFPIQLLWIRISFSLSSLAHLFQHLSLFMISWEREIGPWIFCCGFSSAVSWVMAHSLLVQGFSGTAINSCLFWVQCISN